MKNIFTILLTCAATSLFALEFYVGNVGDKQPEGGYKISNCPWGRSLHYKTDLYKMRPLTTDNIVGRGGQTIEIDQNLNVGGITSIVSKLIYAKSKKINLRNSLSLELHQSKVQFDDCELKVGKHLRFTYWHKSNYGGISTVEFNNTKAEFKGSIFCIVPVHPKVEFAGFCGPNIILRGNSKVSFGFGAVIDEIFYEVPNRWKAKINFVLEDNKVPMLAFGGEAKVRGVDFEFNTRNAKNVKPGTYPLLTLTDKDSKFANAKFVLNGASYNLGDSFNLGGRNAKIVMGASPQGRDSSTANDILLIVSK